MRIAPLEQFTNEQVGAAAKALMLTWVISAEEIIDGEPVDKLDDGAVELLRAQALSQDTEVLFHAIGYSGGVPSDYHDKDVATEPHEKRAVAAAEALADLLAQVVKALQDRG